MRPRFALLIAGLALASAAPLGAEEKQGDASPASVAVGSSEAAPSFAPPPTPPTVERVLQEPSPTAASPATGTTATLAPAAAPAETTETTATKAAAAPPAPVPAAPPVLPATGTDTPAAAVPPPATASVAPPATLPDPSTAPATAPAPVPAVAAPAVPPPAPAPVAAPAPSVAPRPATASSAPPAADPAVAARAALASAIAEWLAKPEATAQAPALERDAVRLFYAARANVPLWSEDGTTFSTRGKKVLAALRAAGDWGLSEKTMTPPAEPTSAAAAALAEAEIAATLAALRYADQARGGRIAEPVRQLSRNLDRKPQLVAPATVLAALADAADPQAYLEGLHPRHPQFERLRQKWLALRNGETVATAAAAEKPTPANGKKSKSAAKAAAGKAKLGPAALADKLLVNMEQWRWMPEDLGKFHVWSNVPEYTVRVMRDGAAIHTERIIIGKPNTQTPIFSNAMNQVVFHPYWGVPDSIKRNEILPSLAKGGSVLARHNLRLSYKGRPVDASSIDWSSTDIRNLHVYQPPGAGNVLGVVKFLFPNHHQVYMHDTPTKNLFASATPMYSHGCMRVRDPLKLAEVLLAEDKGWTRARVDAAVASKRQDQQITLETKYPVHVTYFTARVDNDGTLHTFADVYGHEKRIALGMAGRFREIAPTPASSPAQPIGRLVEAKQKSGVPDWARAAFSQQ
jgi:murein L,D-transpeptidase YcbB/YkuD